MLADVERFIWWVRMRSPQAKTWRDYKSDLDLFIAVVGNKQVGAILPRDIDDFVNFQVQKGYKPSTVNRRLAAIVSFYRFLLKDGMLISCPVLPKRHYLREPQRLPRPINQQDLHQYFQSICDDRDMAMFTLMLRCGLRIGEVSALEMSDLYLGEAPSRLIIRGKGVRERTAYLSPEAERALRLWLAQRPRSPDNHVFLSYQLKRLSTTSITKRIHHVGRISGVHLNAHRLRHTFADHLLSAGTPITSIQKLMGHRFVETTQNYALVNDQQVQRDFYKAIEKLEGWTLLVASSAAGAARIEPSQVDDPGHHESMDIRAPAAFSIPRQVTELPFEILQQLERYRQWKVQRWRSERIIPNSILFYSQHGNLWRFFSGFCGVMALADLRLEHVRQFMQFRLDRGCAATTVNVSLSMLRSFLGFLQEDQVEVHPSLQNIQRLKEADRLPRYLPREQVLRLKNEVEAGIGNATDTAECFDAALLRSLFYLLWQGGLRSGEVELLRFSDCHIADSGEPKRLFIRDGKWRRSRAVYLTEVAWEALRSYLALRGSQYLDGFVFVRNGLPLRRDFLSRRLKALGKQVEVSVSPHRLRHTFASQLLNVGCQVTSIQRLLGHNQLNTTMTYARAFDNTVMLDYFTAIDLLEAQPNGAWHTLVNGVSSE